MKKILNAIIAVGLAIFAGILYITGFWALGSAPWVPTRKKDMRRIAEALNARAGHVIYDLGCGDGRLCVELARHTKAKIVGIELSFFYYVLARWRVLMSGLKEQVTIEWGNFYKKNLGAADRIFFYLTKKTAAGLAHKIREEVKSGAAVVTYRYPIPNWEHLMRLDPQPPESGAPIFVYDPHGRHQKISFNLS